MAPYLAGTSGQFGTAALNCTLADNAAPLPTPVGTSIIRLTLRTSRPPLISNAHASATSPATRP